MNVFTEELTKLFIRPKNKVKIGFVIPKLEPYSSVMASTRIRVYDVINAFKNDKKYFLEIYKPAFNYNLIIFQKYFDKKAYLLAKKLKQNKSKIILDLNVNYFEKRTKKIRKTQYNDILKFSKLCDAIIVSSPFLFNYIKRLSLNKYIFLIEESIHQKYFKNWNFGLAKASGKDFKRLNISNIKPLKIF